ncbi:Dynamin-A [Acropora cervicornis]|uniref:Dynamin-A n=1 Tax=Acropora cervicornis TaxID=6130 RepID=A0AAD9Q8J0_ACRCE|nr:Dynamin-A [Acropora cervicornis]
MSGAKESPVSKYGRSSEFGAVLDFIQTMISNDTLRQAFNIPHLVIVGRQNMAKTTLINRLIGRYLLPMRRMKQPIRFKRVPQSPKWPEDKSREIGGAVEDPTDDLVEQFLNKGSFDHLGAEEINSRTRTPNLKMSVPKESPVSKYGRSSEFGAVLDFIQTMISNDTLRQAFNIPHLVIVGRQNMAKTTLINRLIGRYLLPMRRNETANTLQARTTCPIILNLRHDQKTKVEVRCEGVPRVEGEDPTDIEVERFLNDVSNRLDKEEGTPISKTPVNVTLQGPSLTTLTLVDLPGVHFANDNNRMNDVTQQLVLEYIKKNTKSIIVIVSEVGDPTGDNAINLVKEQAENFKTRTICVLTKPDKLRMEDDMGKKVALNQSSFTLEDGRFIVLRGKDGTDPKEKDWDAEKTQIKEKE